MEPPLKCRPYQGVVQRAYNAYPVRLQERLVESTSKLIRSRVREKVVSTADIAEGELCIEMRIRHYEDGAMSKLLASLAEASFSFSGRSRVPDSNEVAVSPCDKIHTILI